VVTDLPFLSCIEQSLDIFVEEALRVGNYKRERGLSVERTVKSESFEEKRRSAAVTKHIKLIYNFLQTK